MYVDRSVPLVNITHRRLTRLGASMCVLSLSCGDLVRGARTYGRTWTGRTRSHAICDVAVQMPMIEMQQAFGTRPTQQNGIGEDTETKHTFGARHTNQQTHDTVTCSSLCMLCRGPGRLPQLSPASVTATKTFG